MSMTALYDELKGTGARSWEHVMASSPTVNVGYEVLSELPKERHESPMLSLDKTKEVAQAEGICRRPDGCDLMEDGWSDDRSDLS